MIILHFKPYPPVDYRYVVHGHCRKAGHGQDTQASRICHAIKQHGNQHVFINTGWYIRDGAAHGDARDALRLWLIKHSCSHSDYGPTWSFLKIWYTCLPESSSMLIFLAQCPKLRTNL